MKVICDIYGRVSTAEQAAEGYSIGEQESRLRMFAESQGWIIHDVLMDGGFSGAKLDRPAVQKLIEDARSKKINKVVVYKLDRLSRSQKDTLFLIEDVFLKNDVDFVSMTESLDTSTPFGLAMVGILATFAQLERETIKSRMMMGRDAKVKSGKYHGQCNDIIGYKYFKENNTLTLDDYDAMVVRNIFERYALGSSESSIARKLSDMDWRGSHSWSAGKVNRILNQPLYIGYQRWKGQNYYVENCPHIISDELWEAVKKEQARRSTKTVKPHTAGHHVTLLGGLIWCKKCGGRYMGYKSSQDGVRYRYYCRNQVRTAHHEKYAIPCKNKGWRESELNEVILDQIRLLKVSRDIHNVSDSKEYAEELRTLQSRLSAIQKQQEKLIDLFSIGSIDRDILQRRIEALNKERTAVAGKIEEIKKPTGTLNSHEFDVLLNSFDDLVNSADAVTGYLELQPLVNQLIKSITIDDDTVEIQWNFEA